MIELLLAASFTFSATATGVEKGAPVEFYWVDKHSDRDYEALFILDRTQKEFRRDLEKAGLKPGKAVDNEKFILWPVGCPVKIAPSFEEYVEMKLPAGYQPSEPIFTGNVDGTSGFAFYSLSESAIVFNGIYPQGDVYNSFTVKKTLKKGEKVEFTITWDESKRPKALAFDVNATNLAEVIGRLRQESEKHELDVKVDLSPDLTVRQAQAIANALQVIDTPRIKMNGTSNGRLFFKAFLPQISWLTRKDRLVQPFELTLGETPDKDKLIFIDEDWTVEGDDPKLTLLEITFAEALKKEKTNTCLIFATPETTLERIEKSIAKLKGSSVTYWYVYDQK